jgi:uncharacterized protein YjiK
MRLITSILAGMIVLAALSVSAAIAGCAESDSTPRYRLSYDFSTPTKKLTLPSILNEISGQTIIDSVTFACVQDENGIIFIYDSKKNEIRQQINFAGDGDYEGICKVENDLYVLRSDGVLFLVHDYANAAVRVDTFDTHIPADNNEGLCYDSINHQLLIACKGKIAKGAENKDKRFIYSFNLETKNLSSQAEFEFDVAKMIAFADEHDIDLPRKEKKKGSQADLKFRISAIAIHPLSGELYVLSAVDHALFIFDNRGTVLHIEMLDEQLFNKAEGISFYRNSDVLITNEAQDKKPTLLKFAYRP